MEEEHNMMPVDLNAEQTEREFRERFFSKKTRSLKSSSSSTTEEYVGWTILVDFPVLDDDGVQTDTLWNQKSPLKTKSHIENILNGETWDPSSSTASLREYYRHSSCGKMSLSSIVTDFIMMDNPRSYYDDPTKSSSSAAPVLIDEIYEKIVNDSEFSSKYQPVIDQISYKSGRSVSFTIIIAGGESSTWNKGLWAHSWSIDTVYGFGHNWTFTKSDGTNVRIYGYTLQPVAQTYFLGTLCHESLHQTCSFPDLYESGNSSNGGVGRFCIMGTGGNLTIPSPPNPYFRYLMGWIDPIDITEVGGKVLEIPHDIGTVYKYRKDGDSKEYFLIEHKQKSDGDWAQGILIWRVYTAGSNYSVPGVVSIGKDSYVKKYMVSIVEPDGSYSLHGSGKSGTLQMWGYYGNNDEFNDETSPTARWLDGTESGLKLSGFKSNRVVNRTSGNEIGLFGISYSDGLGSFQYTGEPICPDIDIHGLERNVDYTVQYFDNIERGTGRAVITGIGNYRDQTTMEFQIV